MSHLGAVNSSMVAACGAAGTYVGITHFSVGAYMERTFEALPSHTALRIRASAIRLDGYFELKLLVDGGLAWSDPVGSYIGAVCGVMGYNKNEYGSDIDVTVGHVGSTATVRFTSDNDNDAYFWGVNAVLIDLVTDHPSPPAPPSPPGTWGLVASDTWPGATGWSSNITLDSSAITTCGEWTMLGGYGQLKAAYHLQKSFDALPSHTSLRIRATLYKIDYWDKGFKFELRLDGVTAWQSATYTTHGDWQGGCGLRTYGKGDLAVDVDVTVAHTASSATLHFSTTVASAVWSAQQDYAYWGLQGVTVQAVETA